MNKEIKYSGFSAVPSDYECPDGDLSVAMNLIPEDGAFLIMEGFVDEETDEFFGYCVAKYVIVREDGDSGDSTIG